MRVIAVVIAAAVLGYPRIGLAPIAPPAPPPARPRVPSAAHVLDLHVARFDPLVAPSPALPDTGDLPPATRYRVAQFHVTPTREAVRTLRRAGARVVAYLPASTWVVRLPSPGSDLPALPGLRWTAPLPPSWRLDPALRAPTGAPPSPPGAQSLLVAATTFIDAASLGARDELAALPLPDGATRLSLQGDESGRVTLIVRVEPHAASATVRALARHEHTEWVQPFQLPVTLNGPSALLLQGSDPRGTTGLLWQNGITGVGQIVAVADSGLDTDACQFRLGDTADRQTRANDTQPPQANVTNPDDKVLSYYVIRGAEAYDDAGGAFHGTHTSGNAVGDDFAHLASAGDPGRDDHDGVAPGARLVFQDIGDHSGQLAGILSTSIGDLHRQAYDSGARIHNDSFGEPFNDVFYRLESAQADQVAWRLPDYLIVFAAGNNGPGTHTLGGGGSTAKNTLVVGASMPASYEGGDALADFSSQGPTIDSRYKPDVIAPGVVHSATEIEGEDLGCCDPFGRTRFRSKTDPPNDQCAVDERPLTGTSYSAPLVAGAAALVRQYFTQGYHPSGIEVPEDARVPSSALLKAVIVNGARGVRGGIASVVRGTRIAEVPPAPSFEQGFGLVNLDNALALRDETRRLVVLADLASGGETSIGTDQVHPYTIEGVVPGGDLVVTLVWTDPFGSPMARTSLVNDLDLEVVGPDGTLWRGNMAMEGGFSRPVTVDVRDQVNTVEQVRVDVELGGDYGVRVRGTRVPGNGDDEVYDTQRQGYALVATGHFTEGEPRPLLDMTAVHVSGGCDGDGSLERGETVDIEVTVRNVGTADAVQTVVTVATSPLSDVPADVVTYDGGARARVDVGRLAPGQFGTARARASLVAREQPFCGRDLSLQIEALADGVAARTFTFSLPTDVDLEGERGRCERAPCTAAPVITAVTPERLVRGTVAAQVVVTGDHFVPGVELRLGADLVPARVERVDATRLVAHDVHVAEGALPGVRNVAVVNPDDQAAVATGALTVALRLEVAAAGRGCGCSATAPGDGVLGTLAALAGAWALRTRRRRAH